MAILPVFFRVRPGVVGYLLSSRIRNAHSFAAKRQKRNSENKNLGRLLHKLSVTLIDFYSTGAMWERGNTFICKKIPDRRRNAIPLECHLCFEISYLVCFVSYLCDGPVLSGTDREPDLVNLSTLWCSSIAACLRISTHRANTGLMRQVVSSTVQPDGL